MLKQAPQKILLNAEGENSALKISNPAIFTLDSSMVKASISAPANNVKASTTFLCSLDHSKNSPLRSSSFLMVTIANNVLETNGTIKNIKLEENS